jgi:hypothetical protein
MYDGLSSSTFSGTNWCLQMIEPLNFGQWTADEPQAAQEL